MRKMHLMLMICCIVPPLTWSLQFGVEEDVPAAYERGGERHESLYCVAGNQVLCRAFQIDIACRVPAQDHISNPPVYASNKCRQRFRTTSSTDSSPMSESSECRLSA
ncbi:hypothetical protein EDD86DRAFT_141186 [Gorgonomyces haynaldii]|nr:hypothetical protein EDD86DRAFT_141186 [Gorgonomyces haynaldii]